MMAASPPLPLRLTCVIWRARQPELKLFSMSGRALSLEQARELLGDERVMVELPREVRDLAGVLGLDATLRLAEHCGGARTYFPKQPDAGHALARLLSADELKRACAYLGGEYFMLPRCRRLRQLCCEEWVGRAAARGVFVRDIALELGVTERQVWRQLAAYRARQRREAKQQPRTTASR